MEALLEFVSERKPVHLQQVYLVIFQDKMVKNMLKGVRSGGHSAAARSKGRTNIREIEEPTTKHKLLSRTLVYIHSQ